MTQLFNGVNFVYRSVEVYLTFCSYLRVLVRIGLSNASTMADGINYTGDLLRYVLDRLLLKCWRSEQCRSASNNYSREQFEISTDSRSIKITFAMSVIEKVGEFLNTLTMQYELLYKWWINAVVMILSVPHCLCWSFYFQNIIQALTLGLWMQWPGGPVDLKTYWPPQKLTGPPKN